MRAIQLVVLGVAAAAGVGVVAWVQTELDSARQQSQQPPAETVVVREAPRTQVLVASKTLSRGQTLGPGDVTWRDWPADAVPPEFITREANAEAASTFVGRVVRQTIVGGEPIIPAKIVMLDSTGIMSAILRDGMRALAITVAPETGAGGFILPADYVDVILTREEEVEVQRLDGSVEKQDYLFTDTLLRSVRVLAIDTTFNTEGEAAVEPRRTATLEVTPAMAELLSLAERAGRITLSLRAFADTTTEGGEQPLPEMAVDIDRIARFQINRLARDGAEGEERQAPVETNRDAETQGAPRRREVTVVRGTSRSSTTVD